ncbi:hypothetical protein BDZ91DRAFT_736086 [Kalaharituber pfeilii]|nr:hypothetical protein BDZ91DRAFT_736086 [Kalaharituber pfeilii]
MRLLYVLTSLGNIMGKSGLLSLYLCAFSSYVSCLVFQYIGLFVFLECLVFFIFFSDYSQSLVKSLGESDLSTKRRQCP